MDTLFIGLPSWPVSTSDFVCLSVCLPAAFDYLSAVCCLLSALYCVLSEGNG